MADPELAAKRRIKRGMAKRAARQRKVDTYTRDKPRPLRRMAPAAAAAIEDDD
jgi:hypothetical protein